MDIRSHSWWHRSSVYFVSRWLCHILVHYYYCWFRLSLLLTEVLVQFLDMIVSADDIPDDQKARICKKLGETDKVCPTKITELQLYHVRPFLVSHDLYSSKWKPRTFFIHTLVEKYEACYSRVACLFFYHVAVLWNCIHTCTITYSETSIVSVTLHFSPFPFRMIPQCLVDGADEYLQLLDVASETIRALFNMPRTLVF